MKQLILFSALLPSRYDASDGCCVTGDNTKNDPICLSNSRTRSRCCHLLISKIALSFRYLLPRLKSFTTQNQNADDVCVVSAIKGSNIYNHTKNILAIAPPASLRYSGVTCARCSIVVTSPPRDAYSATSTGPRASSLGRCPPPRPSRPNRRRRRRRGHRTPPPW